MADEQQEQESGAESVTTETAVKEEAPKEAVAKESANEARGQREGQRGGAPPRDAGAPREGGGPREGGRREGGREGGGPRDSGRREGERGGRESRGGHPGGGERREGGRGDDRRGGERGRFEGPPEIDLEKLISDPLYLDNQAHGVVSRMRDMDSGTKSQLRRLYNAVRRAVRAPESERQQQFVMLRARLAYTIARHSLRSLDSLEKLLLQVTRKNDARGYERFRDLFEAIVAYNE
jgi:CRISPR type III-A-associated protein Csm2